ncbi:helix-turn-helix domain-containing protein [Candidatus Dojkabacteria bacterium]|uniref:Helix-turn-helix domain-containing protein n=1 Tax=Candidatus Dojkabacteria bacterium TaxID=2099670 RepID=A0A955KZY7_9BACT|nr:helix-turn-helix domain-containing protein [Candidatus Dojkabacteria bacterium]
MVDKSDILTNLQKIGLDPEESTVYLELTNHQAISILELSKHCGIPRSTVYRVCENLVNRRYAEWVVPKRGAKVKAIFPKQLSFLVKDRQEEAKEVHHALHDLSRMINGPLQNVSATQVRYYEGIAGLKQTIWNSLQAKGEIIGYSTYGRREIVTDKWYAKYVREFRLRKLRDRVITNEQAVGYLRKFMDPLNHQQEIKDVRLLPQSKFYISGDVSIYNNVYSVSYWKQGEIVGVEIENPEMVKTQKSIFELLWEQAESLENYL